MNDEEHQTRNNEQKIMNKEHQTNNPKTITNTAI